MFKKRMFLPLMIVLVLALTACSTDNGNLDSVTDIPPVKDQEETPSDPTADDNNDANIPGADYASIKIKPEEAFDIYMEKFPTTKVEKVKIDKEMGQYVYKVEGFEGDKEYEIKIDSMDGSVIKEDIKTNKDMNDMEITRAHIEKVTAIVDKAMTEAGEDALLDEWTIEMDDGKAKLEIEIDKKASGNEEQTYDVETGELLEID